MNVSFYGHVRQYESIKGEIDAKMNEVLMSGKYVLGPMLSQFEAESIKYFGTKHAIGVGNGTDAIWLVLMALGMPAMKRSRTRTRSSPRRKPSGWWAPRPSLWIAIRRRRTSIRTRLKRRSTRRRRRSFRCISTASARTCRGSGRLRTSTSWR